MLEKEKSINGQNAYQNNLCALKHRHKGKYSFYAALNYFHYSSFLGYLFASSSRKNLPSSAITRRKNRGD